VETQSILQTIYDSALATAIRQGETSFPWLEAVHVLAITMVVGTILIVDLRLIGYAGHRRSARRLILDLLPYTWVAFAAAVITGSLMFASNATKYAANDPFVIKMIVLAVAGINMAVFHLGAYRRIDAWDVALPPPTSARIAGISSLCLWISVVVLGRWIGFVSEY